MAGRGPRPKDSSKRARSNSDSGIQGATIRFVRGEQPELPELPGGFEWCEPTRNWWRMWKESALSDHFMATDWSFLADTATLHQNVWGFGDISSLPELRIRVAKFGATMEDRARLRIQFAEADEADARRPKTEGAKARYGALKVVGESDAG